MDVALELTLDSVIENFDPKAAASTKADSLPFTIWIPKQSKQKYVALQEASKKKYGSAVFVDVVREAIVKTINGVKLEG